MRCNAMQSQLPPLRGWNIHQHLIEDRELDWAAVALLPQLLHQRIRIRHLSPAFRCLPNLCARPGFRAVAQDDVRDQNVPCRSVKGPVPIPAFSADRHSVQHPRRLAWAAGYPARPFHPPALNSSSRMLHLPTPLLRGGAMIPSAEPPTRRARCSQQQTLRPGGEYAGLVRSELCILPLWDLCPLHSHRRQSQVV
jgi:hypothetical protein